MNSKRFTLLLGIVLGLPTMAWGTVRISPAQPTPADSVRVAVSGGFPPACWNDVSQATCSSVQPDTVPVQVSIDYCEGAPNCRCAEYLFSYQRTCTFAPLAAGTYVAEFQELHINPADPLPSVVSTLAFAVTGTTPTFHPSWGKLKSIYR